MHTILDERDKMKFDEELKSIEDNVIVVSKSGEVLNVNDGADEPLKGLRVFGKTEQKTYTGNQLLKYPYSVSSKTDNGIEWTDNGDGSVTMKGNATNDSFFGIAQNLDGQRLTLKAGTYTLSVDNLSESYYISLATIKSDGNSETFVLHANVSSTSFTLNEDRECYIFIIVMSGKSVDLTIKPMLNAGSTALPWEPYVGGIASLNTLYPQELVSVGNSGNVEVGLLGKNLFKLIIGTIPSIVNGSDVSTDEGGKSSDFIRVDKNKNYTLSTSATYDQVYLLAYDADKNYLGFNNIQPNIFSRLKTSYPNLAYVRARFDLASDGTYQFEVGDVATEYKPYTEQPLTISTPNGLPGIPVTDASLATYTDENGRMWCSDEVDYERGVYIQRVAEMGIEYFGEISISKDSRWYDSSISYSYELKPGTHNILTDGGSIGVCSHFASYNFGNFYDKKIETGVMTSQSYMIFNISKSLGICKNVEEFIQWCSDNNVIFIKALKTPIETPLSEEELNHYKALKMNYPNTTILNDSNAHMEVKYIADVQNHIEQNYVSKAEYEAAMSQVSMIETAML